MTNKFFKGLAIGIGLSVPLWGVVIFCVDLVVRCMQ